MTLILLLLPVLFLPFIMMGHQRAHYRSMIALGVTQFLITATLYGRGYDPLPLTAGMFDLTPLNMTFLLAHTGLQVVAFLSLPRVQRTQRHLCGALLMSISSIATITAHSDMFFLGSFFISLFIPCVLALLEGVVDEEYAYSYCSV